MNIELFKSLGNIFLEHGYHLYLVGGAVRDYLLNRKIEDFDLVSDATPEEMCLFLDGADDTFKTYGSVTIIFQGYKIDITTLRKEEYKDTMRHPSQITYVKDLYIDAQRRDFTINALYMDQDLNIYDFYSSREDLKAGIIRMIGDISIRMVEDPLRMLRCLRFKATLNFKIEKELDRFIKENLYLINVLSSQQVNKEIKKIQDSGDNLIIDEYQIRESYQADKIKKRRLKVIDLHCDTITLLKHKGENLLSNNSHVDILKLIKGEYLMQCFAIFINQKFGKMREYFLSCYEYYKKQLSLNRSLLKPVYSFKDIVNLNNEHKIGTMLTIEDGGLLDNELEYLDYLYSLGVRMMTLTWNYPNCIGYPNYDASSNSSFNFTQANVNQGLTEFGFKVVKKMNELGMIIDVSHLSDRGFFDVINTSKHPVVASHSNSRKVCDVVRNLTDEMILKLHENGGVMGINFCHDFISNNEHQLEDIVLHIKHIKNLGCIENIAIGSDFDGIMTPPDIKDASYLKVLADKLFSSGFSEEEIESIFKNNFLRVMKIVLKK